MQIKTAMDDAVARAAGVSTQRRQKVARWPWEEERTTRERLVEDTLPYAAVGGGALGTLGGVAAHRSAVNAVDVLAEDPEFNEVWRHKEHINTLPDDAVQDYVNKEVPKNLRSPVEAYRALFPDKNFDDFVDFNKKWGGRTIGALGALGGLGLGALGAGAYGYMSGDDTKPRWG